MRASTNTRLPPDACLRIPLSGRKCRESNQLLAPKRYNILRGVGLFGSFPWDVPSNLCGGRQAFPNLWSRSPSPQWPTDSRLRAAPRLKALAGESAFGRPELRPKLAPLLFAPCGSPPATWKHWSGSPSAVVLAVVPSSQASLGQLASSVVPVGHRNSSRTPS